VSWFHDDADRVRKPTYRVLSGHAAVLNMITERVSKYALSRRRESGGDLIQRLNTVLFNCVVLSNGRL